MAFDLDKSGRPAHVRLSPKWREQLSAELLGLALTAELASLPSRPPAVAAGRYHMSAGRTAEVQTQLLFIQRSLAAELERIIADPNPQELGERVRSENGRVSATVLLGRVVRMEVDSAWVRRVAVSEVVDRIDECLAKAYEAIDSGIGTAEQTSAAIEHFNRIGLELNE